MRIEDIIDFCKTYFLKNLDKRYVSVSYGLPSPIRLDKDEEGNFEDKKYQVYLNSVNKGKGHVIIRLDVDLEYNEEIIPEYVNLDNFSIPTYIIKTQRFSRTCTDVFFDQTPPLNRNTFRPILGGISVSNFDSQQVIGGYYGTLGCLALDNDTSPPSVVSLSNNHVYSHDMLIAGSRNPNLVYTDHYDDDIVQSSSTSESGGDGSEIGKFKKSWRLRPWTYPQFENLNPGDIAVSTLYTTDPSGEPIIYSGTQGSDIGENNSWYQLNLFDGPENDINFNVNESPLKWAQSFEINNLMSVNLDGTITIENRLYTTGARMGPWGVSNVHTDFGDSLLVPIEIGAQVGIPYISQGSETVGSICNIENCVLFKSTDDPINYESTCIPASLQGNSGSAIVAEFNGEYKIVGILFAGETSGLYGVFCRIDEVASALNLSPFTSETTEFMISNVNQTEIIDLPEPFSNEQYLEVDGKKYWQTGIIQY